jgi:hypothetical protein
LDLAFFAGNSRLSNGFSHAGLISPSIVGKKVRARGPTPQDNAISLPIEISALRLSAGRPRFVDQCVNSRIGVPLPPWSSDTGMELLPQYPISAQRAGIKASCIIHLLGPYHLGIG